MQGREIEEWVSSVPVFGSLALRRSEQGACGAAEGGRSPGVAQLRALLGHGQEGAAAGHIC